MQKQLPKLFCTVIGLVFITTVITLCSFLLQDFNNGFIHHRKHLLVGATKKISIDDTQDPCNIYTNFRGSEQKVIAISIFGPKENQLFQASRSILFLRELIQDAHQIYPGWILRVYHDSTINNTIVRQFQWQHCNIDFCDMTTWLQLPPRMWRFLSAGDPLVNTSK
jgi:hypothetical protein